MRNSSFDEIMGQLSGPDYDKIRHALLDLHTQPTFVSDFVDEAPKANGTALATPQSDALDVLVDYGLVTREGTDFHATKRIWAMQFPERSDPMLLISDGHFVDAYDRTYSPKPRESGLIASILPEMKNASLLDICSGVGTHSIAAVYRFGEAIHATALEVNPRAIKHGMFNAALNGVSENVQFIESDLLSQSPSGGFDYAVFNAPFVPTPPGVNKYWHSDGGSLGDNITRQIIGMTSGWQYTRPDLTHTLNHLKETGKMLFASYTLGRRSFRSTNLYKAIARSFDPHNTHASISYLPPAWAYKRANQVIADTNPVPIELFAQRFEDPVVRQAMEAGQNVQHSSDYARLVHPWLVDLRHHRENFLHYVLVNISMGTGNGLCSIETPKSEHPAGKITHYEGPLKLPEYSAGPLIA